ncbi:MAG: hypothetical protein PVI99_09830 [Anaerolineales bacterium]|jgi:negative regulator of sigma E activity
MKNKNRLHQQEIENLSAYLDHELTEAEEAKIRARLSEDANLREVLEDLRLTRYTLRNAPQVKRQRSFTLTPEMVSQQRFAWRALNFSRIMAVTASVLFVVVLGGQMLFSGQAGMLSFAPQENAAMEAADAEEPMALVAPEEESANDSALQGMAAESSAATSAFEGEMVEEAPAEAPVEEPAQEPSGVGGGPTATPEGSTEPQLEADAPETQEPGGGGGEPPAAAAEPSVDEESRTITAEKDMPDDQPGRDVLKIGDEIMEQEAPAEVPPPDESMAPQPDEESVPLIRWVQIGLAAFALVSTGAWIYFRRIVR